MADVLAGLKPESLLHLLLGLRDDSVEGVLFI